MSTPAKNTILDALSVCSAGLTQTQLISVLHRAGHLVHGRRYQGPTFRRLVDTIPQITCDGRYFLHDSEARARALWDDERLVEVLVNVDEVEPYEHPSHFNRHSSANHVVQRTLRLALLSGDDDLLRQLLASGGANVFSQVGSWFFSPVQPEMMRSLSTMGAWTCMDWMLGQTPYHLAPPVSELAHFVDRQPEPMPAPLHHVSARLAFLAGDLVKVASHLAHCPPDTAQELRGALALFNGDIKTACKHYQAGLANQRKRHGNDFVPRTLPGLYLPVAYLLSGTATRTKQAMTLIRRAQERRWTDPKRPHAGWSHLRYLSEPKLRAPKASHPVAMALEVLVQSWRGEPIDQVRAAQATARLRPLGMHLLADEIDAGATGLVARLRTARPAWRDTLASLEEAFGGSKPVGNSEGNTSRLHWTLSVFHDNQPFLNVREQKRKKASWSIGRKIALDRIHACTDKKLPWTAADRSLGSALRKRTYRNFRGYPEVDMSWDKSATWSALIGHPTIHDIEGKPLQIVRRTPTLRVVKRDGGRLLTLSPPMGSGDLIVEQVGRGYEVTLLEPKQRAAATIIGSALFIPADGAEAVDALVAASSDLFRQESRASKVRKGSAVVHLWLSPKGSAISVELGVLPAGEHGPRRYPGEGSSVVLGTVKGAGARFRRDLDLERAYLAAILALPGMKGALPDVPTLLAIDVALPLLAAASREDIPMMWPQGGALKIRRPTKSMGLHLKFSGGWFEASGDLALEGGDTIALARLLKQLLASSQRFIALNNDTYLELDASLRKHLDLLARVGQAKGKSIRVHPLAISTLARLLEQDGVSATAAVRGKLEEQLAEPAFIPVPRSLMTELRPYQHEAFQWLCGLSEIGAGAILADDMGLGKTITSLALMLQRATHGPALVVAPTSVAGNWTREAERFAPGLNFHRIHNATDTLPEPLRAHDVVVCSYTMLVNRIDSIAKVSWTTTVFDESQSLKNPSTQRHQAALRVQAQFRLALTGTPIENHLGELHAQLSVVNPGLLGSAKHFQSRFARPIESGDRDARRSLQRLARPFLLRRTKHAVLDDLPPRTNKNVLIELGPEEAQLYEAQRVAAVNALDDDARAIDVLAHLVRLRQTACSPRLVLPGFTGESAKTTAFRRICLDLHAAGHRALVFSQFVKHLKLLREVLDEQGLSYAYLDGSTPARKRDQVVSEFQQGDLPFFLISLKAGGLGLNLTAADYVLHMDPWWNPAVEDQASDRAHRIGQRRPVTVYRFIAKGTVEEQILALHHQKRDLAAQILEGSEKVHRMSASDLLQLVRS